MNMIRRVCISALCVVTYAVFAQTNVRVVERPEMGVLSNYPAYRAPLHGGYLLKLPIGAVQPRGWLREMLVRQSQGLNGQLGTVSAWLEKENNQWLSDSGDHGWEEVPYWLRGYCSLAYILDDEAMKREAQVWFEGVLTHLKDDGFLGPKNTSNGRPEVWAQMVMLWALQTYFEYSGDERVLEAMTNYFKWELNVPDDQFLEDYWENKRGGDNEWSVVWLYNRTGDASLLPLIEKLHRNTCNWMMEGDLPNWHGVNVAQGFREPATYFIYSGDKKALQCAYDNHHLMRDCYGQVPGGMYGADENARQGYTDPRQGTETCALVEQMASDEMMMGITGDPFWADHCEDVAFNMLPAALTSDMRALRYITSPNMAVSDGKNHAPSIDNSLRGMLSMSPFSSRCCQHNHGMGWPYFTEHIVMATTDGGLATMLYSASNTTALVGNGQTVGLTMETNYPFEEQVRLRISTTGEVHFPLYLRIPKWSDNTGILVNGTAVGGLDDAQGHYVRLERTWKDGDQIVMNMPMKISTRIWEKNKGGVSVDYGPLTLSLRIDERYQQRDSRDHEIVQDDSHWQAGVDASLWPAYEIFADSDWNYALKLDDQRLPLNISKVSREWPADNYPFTLASVPFEFTATARRIPSWTFDATGMTGLLPACSAQRDSTDIPVRLVPMGAARLRITVFPKAEVKRAIEDCKE